MKPLRVKVISKSIHQTINNCLLVGNASFLCLSVYAIVLLLNPVFAQRSQQLPPPGSLFPKNPTMKVDQENDFWERDFLEGGSGNLKPVAPDFTNPNAVIRLPSPIQNSTEATQDAQKLQNTLLLKKKALQEYQSNSKYLESNLYENKVTVIDPNNNRSELLKKNSSFREVSSLTVVKQGDTTSTANKKVRLDAYNENHNIGKASVDYPTSNRQVLPYKSNELLGDVTLAITGAPINAQQEISWLDYSPSGELLALPHGVSAQVVDLQGGFLNSPNQISGIDKAWFYQYNKSIMPNARNIFPQPKNNFARSLTNLSEPLIRQKKGVDIYPMNPDLIEGLISSKTQNQYLSAQAVGEVLTGHQNLVYSLAFYPNSPRLVSGGGDGFVRVWQTTQSRQLGLPLEGHNGLIYAVAISPNGRVIASAGADQIIYLWDSNTGLPIIQPLNGHIGEIFTLQFSADNNLLFSAGASGVIRVWNVNTGLFLGGLTGHEQAIHSLAISKDGKTLASGGAESKIILWNLASGEKSKEISNFTGNVYSLAFSSVNDTLASAGNNTNVHLWNTITGEQISDPLYSGGNALFSVAFSPDGRQIAAGSYDNSIWMWDTASGKTLPVSPIKGHASWVTSLAFDPSGSIIASGSADGTIRMWTAPESLPSTEAVEQANSPIELPSNIIKTPLTSKVAFSRSNDGKTWVVATDKGIEQFDSANNRPRKMMQYIDSLGYSPYTAVAYSPNDNIIVAGNEAGKFAVYNAKTGKVLSYLPYGIDSPVRVIAISKSEEWIAITNDKGMVRVYRSLNLDADDEIAKPEQTWLPAYSFTEHKEKVLSLAYLDNQILASGSADKTISLYNMQTGKPIGKPYEGQFSPVVSIAVAPDKGEIVTGGRDGSVQRWKVVLDESIIEIRQNIIADVTSPVDITESYQKQFNVQKTDKLLIGDDDSIVDSKAQLKPRSNVFVDRAKNTIYISKTNNAKTVQSPKSDFYAYKPIKKDDLVIKKAKLLKSASLSRPSKTIQQPQITPTVLPTVIPNPAPKFDENAFRQALINRNK